MSDLPKKIEGWETLACGCRRTVSEYQLPVITVPCFQHWQEQVAENRARNEQFQRARMIEQLGGYR